jgi:lipid II:glycine glycyltransferase (peptidoglycan interpeptide bridge formation enzyme)
MNIRALVKTTLNNTELDQAKNFFGQAPYSAFLQNPEYEKVIGKNALHVLLYGEDSNSIIGYALAEAKKKLLTTISFGPICADEDLFPALAISCIKALQEYGFKIIRFQPPLIQSHTWNKTLSHLQKKFTSFSLPSELNWTTLILDISPSEDNLIKSFSENHRRSIKKAKNENLVIEQINSIKEMNGFAEGLCKMYAARKIPNNLEIEKERLKNLFVFAVEKKNGLILIVKKGTQLLGGIILIKHNKSIFYFIGFSDPDYKNIPVNHLLFLKSFECAKSLGCNSFDFGGYGRPGYADEQVLNINRFKDGFKGKRIDHPDTILIAKNSLYKFIYANYIKIIKRKK